MNSQLLRGAGFLDGTTSSNLAIKVVVNENVYDVVLPGIDASIEQSFLENQPVHFGAAKATATPLIAGSFIGDTNVGGSCNVSQLVMVPHCNGTHTETVAHLEKDSPSPHELIDQPFYPSFLLTIKPTDDLRGETYPSFVPGDLVITAQEIQKNLKECQNFIAGGALLFRTLDNSEQKKICRWEIDRPSPYFTREAMAFIGQMPIKHLIVDFPSIDRSQDGGQLLNHRDFFQDRSRTITEMAFFPSKLADGFGLVSLGVPLFRIDAVPSRIIVYQLKDNP